MSPKKHYTVTLCCRKIMIALFVKSKYKAVSYIFFNVFSMSRLCVNQI